MPEITIKFIFQIILVSTSIFVTGNDVKKWMYINLNAQMPCMCIYIYIKINTHIYVITFRLNKNWYDLHMNKEKCY